MTNNTTEQDKFDDYIIEVAQLIVDREAIPYPAMCHLLTTQHSYLVKWYYDKQDANTTAGMLILKSITI
tara:strand:+ start:608 stop:814 length:207 start_codon:yes stop_codon:yes gene_type:complete